MAEKEEKKEASAPAPAQSDGGGSSKLMLILTAVNTVVTLAMVAILFVSFQHTKKAVSVEDIAANSDSAADKGEAKGGEKGEGKEGESKEKPKKKGLELDKMVTLDKFTVNLTTPGSATPKFVMVNISLGVPNDDAETEVNAKMPQVRNTIIDLFNSKRPVDLVTAEGRDYLKDEIKNAINGFLVNGKVKGVFFTNFALST